MSDSWVKIRESTLWRKLKSLESLGYLKIEKIENVENRFSIITVVKYELISESKCGGSPFAGIKD